MFTPSQTMSARNTLKVLQELQGRWWV